MKPDKNGNSTRLISFSGIDGAGKTTQIHALRISLESMGFRVRLIVFWNDAATFTRLRESIGHPVFRGELGIGTPSAPLQRRDKNVRSWPLTCMRMALYLADALSLRTLVRRVLRSRFDVVIFDRYIYDEAANLSLRNQVLRLYVRLLSALVPRPHIGFLLDADPMQAQARKPEFPLDFLYLNCRSYVDLSSLIDGMTIIAPMAVPQVERQILQYTLASLALNSHSPESDIASRKLKNRYVHPANSCSIAGPYQ